MLENKNYSYLLVASQFTCISLLIIVNLGMFTKSLSIGLFLTGVGFFFYTLMFNKISNFNIIPDIKNEAKLITTGPYRYIRHPMYFAVLITMFAPLSYSFSSTNILISTILTITMIAKAKKEEFLWSHKFSKYCTYMKKTKMIIPYFI